MNNEETKKLAIFVGEMIEPSKGKWFDVPVNWKKAVKELMALGIPEGTELCIADWDANFDVPFEIGECESVKQINQDFEKYLDLNEDIQEDAKAIIDAGIVSDFDELVDSQDDIVIFDDVSNDEELGEALYEFEDLDSYDVPEIFQTYFDYESFGRDFRFESNGNFLKDDKFAFVE